MPPATRSPACSPTNTTNQNVTHKLRSDPPADIAAACWHGLHPHLLSLFIHQLQCVPMRQIVGFYNKNFRISLGMSGAAGGSSVPFGSGASYGNEYEERSTGNTSLTWVKGNHNFKFGGELGIDGLITQSTFHANGILSFSANETSDQWQGIQASGILSTSGFGYASFLLGGVDNFSVAPAGTIRLGNHSIGLYAQDSWKVTRKLTLDYGLRYDYQTYLKEQYGRMLNAELHRVEPDTWPDGRTIFEGNGPGHCNCAFSHNYPWAFGPRLGVAYQINPRPYFGEAQASIMEPRRPTPSCHSTLWPSTKSTPRLRPPRHNLSIGNPYAVGNTFGNATPTFPNLNPDQYPMPKASAIRTTDLLCAFLALPFVRQRRTAAAHLHVERRPTARVEPQPGGGSQLRGQPRGMVYGARAGYNSAIMRMNITDLANFKDSQGNSLNISQRGGSNPSDQSA